MLTIIEEICGIEKTHKIHSDKHKTNWKQIPHSGSKEKREKIVLTQHT